MIHSDCNSHVFYALFASLAIETNKLYVKWNPETNKETKCFMLSLKLKMMKYSVKPDVSFAVLYYLVSLVQCLFYE